MLRITAPIKVVSEMNQRGHHMARARRFAKQKADITNTLRAARVPVPLLPLTVTLTRVAPSSGLDSDNLASAFKAVRDAIAAWLGTNDGPSGGVTWLYDQRRGRPREYAVEVAIA